MSDGCPGDGDRRIIEKSSRRGVDTSFQNLLQNNIIIFSIQYKMILVKVYGRVCSKSLHEIAMYAILKVILLVLFHCMAPTLKNTQGRCYDVCALLLKMYFLTKLKLFLTY